MISTTFPLHEVHDLNYAKPLRCPDASARVPNANSEHPSLACSPPCAISIVNDKLRVAYELTPTSTYDAFCTGQDSAAHKMLGHI